MDFWKKYEEAGIEISIDNAKIRNEDGNEIEWKPHFDRKEIDEESDDNCNLVLASDWEGWNKGTTRDTIWHWFDTHYSKGISFLLYKREV